MVTETTKKYTLTEEEISAIQTTRDVVTALQWEDFDSYGEFYSSGVCIEDARVILEIILENNDKNLEQRYSLFFFYPKCWASADTPGWVETLQKKY